MPKDTDAVEKHVLGGRTFLAVIESTVEQDFRFLELIKRGRIDEVIMEPDETAEAFARRLLEATVASGRILDLMGCLLIPEEIASGSEPGDMWTRAIGDETAAFLGSLKAPGDKAKIRALVLSLLISFFDSGIVSLWTSKISSKETIPEIMKSGVYQAVTVDGPNSSGNSPEQTTIDPSAFSDGHCESPSSHTAGK